MLPVLQIVTVILVAVAMALALAHALELPGKMRLDKKTYYAVQPIYYPGFTIGGGIGEAGGTIATIILLLLTPPASAQFWLIFVALLGLITMQAVYWLATHPVNTFWVEGVNLDRFSSGFFCSEQIDLVFRRKIVLRIAPNCAIAGSTRTSREPDVRR
jgi:hypothetical protein